MGEPTIRDCLTLDCHEKVWTTDPNQIVVLCPRCFMQAHLDYDDDWAIDLRDDPFPTNNNKEGRKDD